MQPLTFESITTDEIFIESAIEKNIRLSVLRLDKIHDVISGNKWFKLKYWLQEAKNNHKDHLITFGGAYSNHIVATAAAGKFFGFKTTGVIRGESPAEFSHTLKLAREFGMEIRFMSREDFREKKLMSEDENFLVIPEGGFGEGGVKGAAEILDHCTKENFNHVCCAVGTTTMMAGIIRSSASSQQIIGFAVMKNPALENDLLNLLTDEDQKKNFLMVHNYHFGGYARRSAELIGFMNEFFSRTLIPSDFVYTGKLFFGVVDLVKKKFFPPGSHVLLIHSGGLQGNDSLPKNLLRF